MSGPIPQSYEEWRHCITVECGIPLTAEFVAERLSIWRNEDLEETQRFRSLYGDVHWQATIGWFEQAANEVG
ncbi:MAG: hypothetical protein AAF541_10250 [Pseudomonadota bacterium]